MKNIIFAGLFLLLLVTAVNQAQEPEESAMNCSDAYAMGLEVDALYNQFLMNRSEVDLENNLRVVQEMYDKLGELLEACEDSGIVVQDTELPVTVQHLGSGTPDDPHGFDQAAPAREFMDLRVVENRRPADEWLQEEADASYAPPAEGQEYMTVSVEVLCAWEGRDSCEVDQTNFRLVGDLGIEYQPDVGIVLRDEMQMRVTAGQSRVGVLPFLIQTEDSNLTLIYSPDAFATGEDRVYYRAQVAIEVIATAQLIVRGGPGTQFAPHGGLIQGQIVPAIGRNEDASWLRIPDGWVFAEYLHLREGDALLLPVVEE